MSEQKPRWWAPWRGRRARAAARAQRLRTADARARTDETLKRLAEAPTREAALAAAGTHRNRNANWLATDPAEKRALQALDDELTRATAARLRALAEGNPDAT